MGTKCYTMLSKFYAVEQFLIHLWPFVVLGLFSPWIFVVHSFKDLPRAAHGYLAIGFFPENVSTHSLLVSILSGFEESTKGSGSLRLLL